MSIKPNRDVMRAVIQMAELKKSPFGAALAMGDQVFATAVSEREEMGDLSFHPAMKVIRQVSEMTGKEDLSGYELYSIFEPCADCLKEIVEYEIKTVIYGCDSLELKKYIGSFQNIDDGDIEESGNGTDRISGFLKEKCEALLRNFS